MKEQPTKGDIVEVEQAIFDAVKDAGQQRRLADRLVAWLRELKAGNETLQDRDSVDRHIEALFQATDESAQARNA